MPMRVLWSGGFDSTYLVLSLLAQGERVRAIYLTQDLAWQKQLRETEARRRILAALPPELRAHLDAQAEPERLREDVWARRARVDDELFKIGEERSPQLPLLCAYGQIEGRAAAAFVFGDETLRHPKHVRALETSGISLQLAGLTKSDALHDARRRGFEHLLALTWSCEAENNVARFGPCGTCAPCRSRIMPQIPLS